MKFDHLRERAGKAWNEFVYSRKLSAAHLVMRFIAPFVRRAQDRISAHIRSVEDDAFESAFVTQRRRRGQPASIEILHDAHVRSRREHILATEHGHWWLKRKAFLSTV